MPQDEFDPKVIPVYVEQFLQGKRTLVICGTENAFRIHPANQPGKEILLSEGSISREITVAEAIKLAADPNCKNTKMVSTFLRGINALSDQE